MIKAMRHLTPWAIAATLAAVTSCASATESGTVAGELRAQGGRAPGIDVRTRGVVSISSDDEVLMVLQIDGQFEVELKAGGYRLTATFGNGIGHVAVFESPRLSTP